MFLNGKACYRSGIQRVDRSEFLTSASSIQASGFGLFIVKPTVTSPEAFCLPDTAQRAEIRDLNGETVTGFMYVMVS